MACYSGRVSPPVQECLPESLENVNTLIALKSARLCIIVTVLKQISCVSLHKAAHLRQLWSSVP